ncbi:hypothetical protein F7Q99_38690 [Streptomyces kaniharaensis]|uniref:Uncharacterized protein n=1 Tax=Streptomyces kaniharaensis TaxID=212423 RepID=A0A6N7L281_9ACTN|nr:hypothetical protein [Streptomyces kaniharaensis]MQS17962.1 hypothetical protein [Streptomyces kaniharaensis]
METVSNPSLPALRGNVLAVDLLRACVRHDADDVRDLLGELNTAMRRLTDPAGGVALYHHAKYRAEEMFADAVEALGCRPGDTAALPTTTVAVEVVVTMGRVMMPADVAAALRAFADGDFGLISNLDGLNRMAAVSLATAAAERAAASPEAVLEKLDRLRSAFSS